MRTNLLIYIMGITATLTKKFHWNGGEVLIGVSSREWHEKLEISAGFVLKRKGIGQKLEWGRAIDFFLLIWKKYQHVFVC